jgi:isocitrate lyase
MFPVKKSKTERQFVAAAIAVSISWFNLIWFLRRVPDIGTYLLTLQKVVKTLVKVYGFISGFWASHTIKLRYEGFFVAAWKCSSVTYIYIDSCHSCIFRS